MRVEKIFYRDWKDGAKMKISFIKMGGPIIAIDIPEGSKYEKEIDENEELFRLKKFNSEIENLLKEKGFKECS